MKRGWIRALAIGAESQGQTAVGEGGKGLAEGSRFVKFGQNAALRPQGPVTANGCLQSAALGRSRDHQVGGELWEIREKAGLVG
jgi:hypothetical protein